VQLIKLINKINKNFLIYGVGQAFNLLSPLLIVPYIISVCTIANFGKVGLSFGLSLFLILIVDYAFDIKGTKMVSESRDNIKEIQHKLFTIFYTKMVLLSIAFLILLLLVYTITIFRNEKIIFLLSFIIVIAQVFNPQWFLQGLEDFKTASVINILSKSLYVIFIFCLIKNTEDYIFVNFYLGLSSLLINIFGIFIIQNRFKFNFQKPNFFEIKKILKTDFFFCVSQLFLSLRQLSPLFIVSSFLGFSVAGQYKVVEQIISLFRTFNQVYLKYFFPRLCFKINESRNEALSFWKNYVLLLLVFVVIFCLLLFIFSIHIITFFNISNTINGLFRFSLILPVLMVFSLALEQTMFTNNNNKNYIRITIFVTIINIITLLFLASILNLNGVIISIIIAELFFIFLYFKNSILLKKEIT
jgi:PST family polysaccharide transporter